MHFECSLPWVTECAGDTFGQAELLLTAEVQDPAQPGGMLTISNQSEDFALPEVEVVDPGVDDQRAADLQRRSDIRDSARKRLASLVSASSVG